MVPAAVGAGDFVWAVLALDVSVRLGADAALWLEFALLGDMPEALAVEALRNARFKAGKLGPVLGVADDKTVFEKRALFGFG